MAVSGTQLRKEAVLDLAIAYHEALKRGAPEFEYPAGSGRIVPVTYMKSFIEVFKLDILMEN